MLGGAQPADVVVQVVRGSDGAVVSQWTPGVVPAGVPQTVRWDGLAGGRVVRDGVYQFRVNAVDGAGTRATSAQAAPVGADAPGAFEFRRFRFPIAGAHRYGTGAAAFGGGRGHQGQDTFAACGTPLVAARGGVVEVNDVPVRRRQLPRRRRRAARAWSTPTCTCATRRCPPRASASGPGS